MSDSDGRGRAGRFLIVGLIVVATAGGYLAYRAARGTSDPYAYHSAATTPTTKDSGEAPPATLPALPHPTTTFIDVVRAAYPKYAATRPLDVPIRELSEAGRIVLDNPVYLASSHRSDLWITRSDGLPTRDVLKRAMDTAEYAQVHVLPERVRFVHWNPGEAGWTPFVVCETSAGGLEVVSPERREPIAGKRKYDWSRANSWNDKVVVPSEAGVSIFRFEPSVTEDYRELIEPRNEDGAASDPSPPQALLDWQGLLAWVPAENGRRGSRGAARYVDDHWSSLGPEEGWPEQIMHLVPLRDGSVLQMTTAADGSVKLALATLYTADVSEQTIAALVEQMSDPDSDRRETAFKDLSQYGPGVYPMLEKLAEGQPPETRTRLRSLMRAQVTPTLGGMTLIGQRIHTVTRQDDGGAVFFVADGVSIPREEGEPSRRVPAWLSVRPGRAVEVLDNLFVSELKPDESEIMAAGNECVVLGDAAGPRRWVGNGFVPLLRKDERDFTRLVGIDRRGRWLFRKANVDEPTLILDPNLPDPTPRLPHWEYLTAREFGWDADDWPTVRREGGDWSLRESGWKLLRPSKGERLISRLPTSQPTRTSVGQSRPSTASTQALGDDDAALLVTDDGSRYYDGLISLRVVRNDGHEFTWPLPPAATGQGPATLLRTADGLLFLFNQPGRVLRIRPTPGEAEPFTIEATFTRRIPSVTKPRRIWLDPAGRICVVDVRRVVIFFPQGFIPPKIRDMMPADSFDAFAE